MFSLSESPSDVVDVVRSSEQADEIISSCEDIISSAAICVSRTRQSSSSSLTNTTLHDTATTRDVQNPVKMWIKKFQIKEMFDDNNDVRHLLIGLT